MNTRNTARALAAALMLTLSTLAGAHTRLSKSLPADASEVAAVNRIELVFSDTVQLTALTLQKDGAAAKPIAPLPDEWGSTFALPVESLAAGEYVVNWSAATDDGHTATGKLRFKVVSPPAGHHGH